jgi:2'-hydroxyisoflavone reductase
VLIHYPGLIIGPHESVGRSWWYTRIARGGDVLAPGDPGRQIQLIDARDIARFGLRCLESGTGLESGAGLESGTDEADGLLLTSPAGHTTFGAWLAACVAEAGSDARLRWAPDELLLEHEVAIWTGLPLWAPVREDLTGTWSNDVSHSLAAGLACRPIEDTVRDTWAWLRDAPPLTDEDGRINGHGLPPADEQRILDVLTEGSRPNLPVVRRCPLIQARGVMRPRRRPRGCARE